MLNIPKIIPQKKKGGLKSKTAKKINTKLTGSSLYSWPFYYGFKKPIKSFLAVLHRITDCFGNNYHLFYFRNFFISNIESNDTERIDPYAC